jgi:hypothetical protein
MISIPSLFDEYNRQARVYPSLLSLLPVLITIFAWFPGLLISNWSSTLVTLVCSCGLLYLLATFSRSRGKRVELRLLKDWGGWPTTLWLRHSDANLPPMTKQRYHRTLAKKVPNLKLPTAQQERTNIVAADEVYRSATEWLKERTRDKKFSLVHKENAEYGFRRNMRGVRPFAVFANLLALVATIVVILSGVSSTHDYSVSAIVNQIPSAVLGAILLLVVSLIFWITIVRDSWVRQAGDQYARALLATCENL